MKDRITEELTTGNYYLEDILRVIELNSYVTEEELHEAFARHRSIDKLIEALSVSQEMGISFQDALERV